MLAGGNVGERDDAVAGKDDGGIGRGFEHGLRVGVEHREKGGFVAARVGRTVGDGGKGRMRSAPDARHRGEERQAVRGAGSAGQRCGHRRSDEDEASGAQRAPRRRHNNSRDRGGPDRRICGELRTA